MAKKRRKRVVKPSIEELKRQAAERKKQADRLKQLKKQLNT